MKKLSAKNRTRKMLIIGSKNMENIKFLLAFISYVAIFLGIRLNIFKHNAPTDLADIK